MPNVNKVNINKGVKQSKKESKESVKNMNQNHTSKDKVNKRNGDGNHSNKGLKSINPSTIVNPWYPSSYVALKALISARLCSAIWGLINDCDETFNYWEPTHYLLYGRGFQTWEYSPQFALRSYTYLMLHAMPAYFYTHLIQSNHVLVFFFIRCLLALICSCCELYFYRAICKEFGANVGRITLGIMIFSAGMFISATAFLPSSFAMYMCMLSIGAWYKRSYQLAIFTTAISVLIGWPFSIIIGLPIAFDMLVMKRLHNTFIKWSLISAATIVIPMILIESEFYGRLVLPPLHIVMYNIFTSHGPDLYGTEPFSFYIRNGLLNFNLCFPAAVAAVPLVFLVHKLLPTPVHSPLCLPVWLSLSSLYLWLSVYCTQAHKEERFLFPVFPLFCLAAAVTIDLLQKVLYHFQCRKHQLPKHYLQCTIWISIFAVSTTSVLSLARVVGQYRAYRAPLDTFMELNRIAAQGDAPQSAQICIGKEWYRFPSSFFLPYDWSLHFLRSEFKGQLPQPFSPLYNGTAMMPPNMNDMNKEEISRYVDIQSCDYLIDLEVEDETPLEPKYSAQKQWKVVHSVPFMDSNRCSTLLRAFYIPFLTESHCHYNNYVILKAVRQNRKKMHR